MEEKEKIEENNEIESKTITFRESRNPAKNFGIIINKLEKIAQNTGISMMEILNMFDSDLKNHFNEDYKKKIKNIELKEASPVAIKTLVSYVDRAKKTYQKQQLEENRKAKQQLNKEKTQEMEKKWEKIEETIDKAVLTRKEGTEVEITEKVISDLKEGKSGYDFDGKEKKYMIKKLRDKLDRANEKEIEKAKAIDAMEYIEKVVEREYCEGKVKNKAEYFQSIKKAMSGKDKNANIDVNMGEKAKEYLLQMLDERVAFEKDVLYYDQVYEFTDGFKFLRELPEIERAMKGSRNKKFTDSQSYERFYSLRSLLRKEYDEYKAIDKLLKSDDINETDKRILSARKNVMDKVREKQQPESR